MDKIIRVPINVSNTSIPRIEYTYYQRNTGPFSIWCDDYETKLFGEHWVCLGSTYFHGNKGEICGLEILDGEYEVVNDVPSGLIE